MSDLQKTWSKKFRLSKFFIIALLSILSFCVPSLIFAQTGSDLLDPLFIPKFENQLTGPPPVYVPKLIIDNDTVVRHEYTVSMESFKQQVLPPSLNLLTPVYGYGGIAKDAVTGESLGYVQSTPGSIFEAIRGIPVQVTWINNISSPHMLPVDPTLHWANPNNDPEPTGPFPSYPPGYPEMQSPVPLVTHLHGAEVQSYSDGVPTQWFTYDGLHGSDYYTLKDTNPNSAVYYYPNMQQPTTLWYHDHALGITRINMMSGLSGFYLLRETNSSIDYVADLLPKGKYEMPIVIQDRTFSADGSLYYPQNGINPDVNPYWNDAFLGNTIVVNGKVWPNLDVDKGQYRFRILDSSNTRIYSLSFVNMQTGETLPIVQIGTDGGYLKSSVTVDKFIIAPAERVDVLIDFSDLAPGTKVILKNTLLTYDFPNEDETLGQIMQFTVTSEEGFKSRTLPAILNPTLEADTFPNLPFPVRQRILPMFEVNGQNGPLSFLLNGQMWGGEVSETPRVGETEEWVFVDLTNMGHPIHLHLIQFQLVSRQDINVSRYAADWISLQREALGNNTAEPPWPIDFIPKELPVQSYLIGMPRPPALNEAGWKDTVLTYPNTVTIIRARWTSQDGSPFPFDATQGPGYVWHCHILEHEDNEMMRPYIVLPSLRSMTFPISEIIVLVLIIVLAISLFFILRRR